MSFCPESKLACGLKHCIAVSDTGIFYSWGSNSYGQLANKQEMQNVNPNHPQERKSIQDLQGKVLTVSCQDYATFFIILKKDSENPIESEKMKEKQILYAVGKNDGSLLGVLNNNEETITIPQPVFIYTKEYASRVFCGPNYTAMISEGGKLYTWGNGSFGNLGHDNNDNLQVPTMVNFLRDKFINMASCGAKHMLALSSESLVYSWGTGENGRLGLGDMVGRNIPTLLDSFINKEIKFIECGESHSMALSSTGDAFSWGCGSYYRLGHGDQSDQLVPKQIQQLMKKRIVQVAAGMSHNLAITLNGEVYGWGSPMNGVLGISDLQDTTPIALPRILNRLEGMKVNQSAVGRYHSIICNQNGDTLSWGHQGDLRLGYHSKGPEPFPKKILGVDGVNGVTKNVELGGQTQNNKQMDIESWKIQFGSLGSQHTMALTVGGSLWAWGEGNNGALGAGNNEDKLTPSLLSKSTMGRVIQVCCGEYHTMVINVQGEVFTWGQGGQGQLGTGNTNLCNSPKLVDSLNGKRIVQGCSGESFNGVLTDQGDVYTWGDSDLGKLGLGQNVNIQYYPRIIKDFVSCQQISAGMAHMAAISKQGLLYTWGSGFGGRLGHGDQENQYIPKPINSISQLFKQVSCGNQHTIAIDESQYLYIWGSERRVCSFNNILMPVKIPELKNRVFKQVSAGQDMTMALSVEGEIYVWGQNLYGKLGLGLKNQKNYQIQPSIIETVKDINFVQIYCKYNHCMAITDKGDVYTWGAGGSGRLGHSIIETLLKPKRLEAKWNAIDDDDEQEEDNDIYDFLQQKVMMGDSLKQFMEIMILLQSENENSFVPQLQKKEQVIQDLIQKLEGYIKGCKDAQTIINKFENEINKVILQRRFQLRINEYTVGSSFIDPLIANKVQIHEKIIWILQVQPCYLQKLINHLFLNQPDELESTMKAINFLFQNVNLKIENAQQRSQKVLIKRDQLLYLNLCKIVIKNEVQNVEKIEQLFGITSTTSLFLRTFFKRELGSTISDGTISKTLKDLEQVASKKDLFTILPKDVALRNKIEINNRSADTLINDKKIRSVIEQNTKEIRKYSAEVINNVLYASNSLPYPLKVAISYAKQCIEQKYWSGTTGVQSNQTTEFQQKITSKLVILLFKNLIFPIIEQAESEGILNNINEILRSNLQNLTQFLNYIAEKHYISGGEIYLSINTYLKQQWDNLAKVVRNYMSTTDISAQELSLISYETQFVIDDPIIQMPQSYYLKLLINLLRHKDHVILNGQVDSLYDLIKQLGSFSQMNVDTELDYKFNIKVPVKFMMYSDDDVVLCQDCQSPIPYFLQIKNKNDLEDDVFGQGIRVKKTVLILFEGQEDDNPIVQVSKFCRLPIKKFNVSNLKLLTVKMQELYIKYMEKTSPPQYELASTIKAIEKMINQLINQDWKLERVIEMMSRYYRERISHRDYLNNMKKNTEAIINQYQVFRSELMIKSDDLQKFLFNSKNFNLLFNYAINERKNIQLLRIKDQLEKKREQAGFDMFPQNIHHEIIGSVKLMYLVKEGIIKKFTVQYNSKLVDFITFHYINNTNEGWIFYMMYKQGATESMLGKFQINNAKFSDMKRTANQQSEHEEKNLGIVFNSFQLIKFLQDKIQKHVF